MITHSDTTILTYCAGYYIQKSGILQKKNLESANSGFDTLNSVRYDYEAFAFDLVVLDFGFSFTVSSDSGRL